GRRHRGREDRRDSAHDQAVAERLEGLRIGRGAGVPVEREAAPARRDAARVEGQHPEHQDRRVQKEGHPDRKAAEREAPFRLNATGAERAGFTPVSVAGGAQGGYDAVPPLNITALGLRGADGGTRTAARSRRTTARTTAPPRTACRAPPRTG